jgi:hypothetical protein
MANEITTQSALFINAGSFVRQFVVQQDAQDIGSRQVGASGPQVIGSTAEAIEVGGVTECGVAWFKNLSADTSVEIGPNTTPFVPFLRLGPGQVAGPLWLGTDEPYAQADSGTVELDYFILDRGGLS